MPVVELAMTIIRFDGYFMLKTCTFRTHFLHHQVKEHDARGKFYFWCHTVEVACYTQRYAHVFAVTFIGAWPVLRIDAVPYTLYYSHSSESQIPAPCWVHTYVNISVNCCITNCYTSQWWEFVFVLAVELTPPTRGPRRFQYIVGFAFWKHYRSLSAWCHST